MRGRKVGLQRPGHGRWCSDIKQFCDVWLCASNRAAKTVQCYRSDLTQFAKSLSRSTTPGRVNRVAIENWIADLQRAGYEASSIRRKLASLRAFYSYLTASSRLRASPLSDVRIRLGACKRLTRVVPAQSVRALIQIVDKQSSSYAFRRLSKPARHRRCRDALIVRLMLLTGVRVGELVSLRIGDVRQDERSLLIRGKGNKERIAYMVDGPTATLMDQFLRARRGAPVTASLFENAASSGMTTEGVRQLLRKLAAKAGIMSKITPHMLRHTAATTLLENGADLRIVQTFLGHDSIRSTERYTHIAQCHLLRVLKRANPLRKVA